jgi:conjugal transfer pilus assembly protein TraF
MTVTNCMAGTGSVQEGWYEDRTAERGFYWYAQEEEQDDISLQKEEYIWQGITTSESWPQPEEAWNLAPKELGNWLDLATQEAVRTPSEENVLRWVQYMDIARRKAMQFSSTWAWVMQKNPQYANASFPMTVPGRRAYNRARFHEVRKVLHENSKRFALLLFIDNGPFTSEAKRLAGMFMHDARWPVKIIDITKTPEIAALLGVRFAPQMWIIGKDNPKPVPVAAGLVSMKQLEMRVYRAVRIITGESEPQEYGVHGFERISFMSPTER